MNRVALETPFPPELVKKRKGAFGQTISYIEGVEYIRRINDAFEANWSYEVISHQILDHEVIVLGKLSAGGVTKQAFGGSQVTRTKDGNEVVSIADDLKAAATDSLKKCCSLYGIGLHLYSGDASNAKARAKTAARQRPSGGNGNGRGTPPDRITIKQLGAINAMARRANYSSDQIRDKAVDMFGVPPERLTKGQASAIIEDLSDELGGSAAA